MNIPGDSEGVDLLPTFRTTPRAFRTAASWMLSTDQRLKVGFASASRLLLMGFYNMTLSQQRLAFMVTTEQEALEGLATTRPGLLIVTHPLERGSALALVEAARSVVSDIRTILILDGSSQELVEAGLSKADGVLREADAFGDNQPLVSMFRTLGKGQRYRSPSVLAAMEAASLQREPWRDALPDLNRREQEVLSLLVQGLGDREIAERLAISYETSRSRAKALRRKLGAASRAQVVAKALQLGLVQVGGRFGDVG